MTPWQVLGVDSTIAVADLRRRYAALIKEFRPETHPQDFARIRAAYEVALPHARRREREAKVADGAPPATTETAPPLPDQPGPAADAPAANEPHPQAELVVALDMAQEPVDAGPTLADRFHAFQAQAAAASGSADEALLPALRTLLQARASASLDDGQALEFALLRGFIESPTPPLTLLFEAGRAFEWHLHPTRLAHWLTPAALREMEARLALSRDLVFARHFSGNGELRRLHSAGGWRPPIVFRPTAVEASAWAQRWRHLAEDADAPALADRLDARTLRRLRGFATTDLLVGAAAAAPAPGLVSTLVVGIVAAAGVFGARSAFRKMLERPGNDRFRAAVRAIARNGYWANLLALFACAGGLTVLVHSENSLTNLVGGAVLVLPALVIVTMLLWRCTAWLEMLAAWPFQWREAVTRLEFDRVVRSQGSSGTSSSFGSRLHFAQRLRAIPDALRLQKREIAARERPARHRPINFVALRTAKTGRSRWRLLWYGAWLVFVILRVATQSDGHS